MCDLTDKLLQKFHSAEIKIYDDRIDHLVAAAAQSEIDGKFLEFGVWQATSITKLAEAFPEKPFVGFDSFEGLPEKWVRSFDNCKFSAKGEFALEYLPKVPPNVTLIKGWFSDTVEPWKKLHSDTISLIHIDCDLYTSCHYILHTLNFQIKPGTVIVFDELCDWNEQGAYQRWREHEWRALTEWLIAFDREVKPISRTDWIEGALKVIK